MIEKIKRVSNPLTVIAIFACLAEISGTIVLPHVAESLQSIFLWFVILFPVFLVGLFFATLNWNHRVLYAPTDFRDDKSFLQTLRQLTPQEQIQRLQEDIGQSTPPPSRSPDDTAPPSQVVPKQPPEARRIPSPHGSRMEIIACGMQAEDLVLKELQMELGLPISRDMGIDGAPGLQFDALAVDRDSMTLTAIEVKYFRTVYFPHDRIQRVLHMGDAFAKKVMEHGHKARFILAIVTDVEEKTHGNIEYRMSQLAKQAQFPPDIRLFRFAELRSKYGLDENANQSMEATK